MHSKAKGLYEGTVRRIPSLHRPARALAWRGGALAVTVLSALLRFDLPSEPLLPFYQLALLLGTYEAGTVRAYRRRLRPGAVVFDVGAHVGYHTVRFARLVTSRGFVYAFEPHPENLRLLRRNVERRALEQVRVIPQAVAGAAGKRHVYETPLSMGHSLLSVKAHTGALDVDATSLDRFSEDQGVERADLIKIDVEGSEPEVLAGMRALAARSPALAVIVEFKPSLLSARSLPLETLPRQLEEMGFAVRVIGPRGTMASLPRDAAGLAALGTCNLIAFRGRTDLS